MTFMWPFCGLALPYMALYDLLWSCVAIYVAFFVLQVIGKIYKISRFWQKLQRNRCFIWYKGRPSPGEVIFQIVFDQLP